MKNTKAGRLCLFLAGMNLMLSGCADMIARATTDAIMGCNGHQIKEKQSSKKELVTGSLKEAERAVYIEANLSRGLDCKCNQLVCETRIVFLSNPLLLVNHSEYSHYLEKKSLTTDPEKLTGIESEMREIEKQTLAAKPQGTCFGIDIQTKPISIDKIREWKMNLVDHSGAKQPVTLKEKYIQDASMAAKVSFLEKHAIVCSENPIDLTQKFSLEITRPDTRPKSFNLEWRLE